MRKILAAALSVVAMTAPSFAQEAATATPTLDIELNAVQPSEAGCRVTFLATNNLDAPLERASVETAFFDAGGSIDRIVTLDFKELTPGKTKVLQFQLAGLDCDTIGRVLINDITACEGEGLEPDACLAGLVTTARPDITFGA